MHHLRVELDPEDPPLGVFHDGQDAVSGCHPPEAGRQGLNPVAVAHPDLHGPGKTVEQSGGPRPFQLGFSILPAGGVDLAAEPAGQKLHPVADPQQRDIAGIDLRIGIRRSFLEHGPGAAGKNDSAGLTPRDLLKRGVIGKHLREDVSLSNPAGNQLRILRPEVENNDDFSPAHRNLFVRSGIGPLPSDGSGV